MMKKFKYYRVHIRVDHGSSAGFEYFCNKKDAQKCLRNNAANDPEENHVIEVIEIKPTKPGIMYALMAFASHPDNG
jgi:hypothetical protein